jgi:cytidylate kinase
MFPVRRKRLLALLALVLALIGIRLASAAPAPTVSHKPAVVLVGMPGAGKTTAAQRAAPRLGSRSYTSGDIIRQTIRERGLPYNAQTDRAVAEEFGRKAGLIGDRIGELVATDPSPFGLVEGFRTPADLVAFKEHLPNATLVVLQAGSGRRYARMLARGRAGETSVEYLRGRDRSEVRRGVRALMRMAELRIRPRGDSLEALDRSLDRVTRQALGRPLGPATP